MSQPDNLPPHDIEAEQGIVAALAYYGATAADMAETVAAEDFYNQAHGRVWVAIQEVLAQGERPSYEAIHVALPDLAKGFLLDLTLGAKAPSLAPARRSAVYVAELAARRRALVAAHDLARGCRALEADFSQVITDATDGLAQVGSPIAAIPPGPDLAEFFEQVEEEPPWVVPDMIGRGDRVLLVGEEGHGKLLRLDEPVPTPSGWSSIGALAVGDVVFDRFGKMCNVTALSRVEPRPDAYELVLSDGTTIEADAEHQWLTVDYRQRQRGHEAKSRTTAEIRRTLHARGGHTVNHAIPVAGPVDCPSAPLPIPPYTLGAWLGDGTTQGGSVTLNRADAPAIEARMDQDGFPSHRRPSGERENCVGCGVPKLQSLLRQHDLFGHKHIPAVYLRASLDQRWALLQGLMDTDGYVVVSAGKGRGLGAAVCELTFTCRELAADALELLVSLGIKVTSAESDAKLNGRVVSRRWRMGFQSERNPFSVPRKANRWQPLRTRRALYRYVVDVRPVAPSPMRCLTVDSPDHSFLVSRAMVPTHNSTVLRQVCIQVACGLLPFAEDRPIPALPTMLVDGENPPHEVRRALQTMYRTAGARLDPSMMTVHSKPEGVDLLNRGDRRWLVERLAANRPALLALGPLYKLHNQEPSDERPARQVAAILDDLRTRFDFALLLEAHAPHATGGRARHIRPYGASLWMRWPDQGPSLLKETNEGTGEDVWRFGTWRPARGVRNWPRTIISGGSWPWLAPSLRSTPARRTPPPELLPGPEPRSDRYAH